MPQYQPPERYPDWSESSSLVTAPTPSQQASGFTLNQRPAAATVNWLFRTIGRSIRYLSQSVNAAIVGSQQELDWRLIGGGQWSWQATTGTLAWSDTFAVQMPGLADSANQAAAGSVVLAAGQVAYVTSNTPFATTGDVTSGSSVVRNLAFESGVTAGVTVTGPGIAANTTVQSVSQSDNSITLSANATATGSKVQLVFASSGALTVQAADVASFAPSANTIVVARCIAGTPNQVHVGINASYMRLLDNESKALLGNGYVTTMRAVAGAALSARQAVFMAANDDTQKTAGTVYPLLVDANAGGGSRSLLLGFAVTNTAAGAVAEIVMSGRVSGFSGLTPGVVYYASPTSPGAMQTTAPINVGESVVVVGRALNASTLLVASLPNARPDRIAAPPAYKSVVDLGYYWSNSSGSGSLPLQRVIYGGSGGTSTAMIAEARPMTHAGSLVGIAVHANNTVSANAKIIIFKNGVALNGTGFLPQNQTDNYVVFAKGAYAFVAGDVMTAAVAFYVNTSGIGDVNVTGLNIALTASMTVELAP